MTPQRRAAAFLLLSVLYLALPAPSALATGGPETVERLFVIQFTTGPGWLPDKPFQDQPMAAEHSRNLRRLREQGVLVMGARYGATGMIVLRASSEAAARAEIEKDPTIARRVFTYTVDEFKPFYGGCVEVP
jgi:uncharacterized protein YciI